MATTPTLSRRSRSTTPSGVIRAGRRLYTPARHGRQGKPRKDGKPSASRSDGLRAAMKAKLASDDDKTRYAKRRETVEPMFGQIKEQQDARRFLRRGRRACRAEWKLLCGTHNLLKALAAHGHPP